MTGAGAHGVILGENDMLMRGVIRSILLSVNQQVFVAADGLEALTLARQFRAGLVLLDIAMPRLNGLLTCQAIRALPGYEVAPIIMLTGYGDQRIREAAQRLGASDFITKPFRPDVLLARLAAHLGAPAHGASTRPPASGEPDDLPSGRVRVWKTRGDPAPSGAGDAALGEGGRAMQIWRDAERKP